MIATRSRRMPIGEIALPRECSRPLMTGRVDYGGGEFHNYDRPVATATYIKKRDGALVTRYKNATQSRRIPIGEIALPRECSRPLMTGRVDYGGGEFPNDDRPVTTATYITQRVVALSTVTREKTIVTRTVQLVPI